jgi:hypothetical protein
MESFKHTVSETRFFGFIFLFSKHKFGVFLPQADGSYLARAFSSNCRCCDYFWSTPTEKRLVVAQLPIMAILCS